MLNQPFEMLVGQLGWAAINFRATGTSCPIAQIEDGNQASEPQDLDLHVGPIEKSHVDRRFARAIVDPVLLCHAAFAFVGARQVGPPVERFSVKASGGVTPECATGDGRASGERWAETPWRLR